MKNSRKLRCLIAAKVSCHDTFPLGRDDAVNSGAALVAGVVGISSDDIGKQMLPGYFILIESQDEIPDV